MDHSKERNHKDRFICLKMNTIKKWGKCVQIDKNDYFYVQKGISYRLCMS